MRKRPPLRSGSCNAGDRRGKAIMLSQTVFLLDRISRKSEKREQDGIGRRAKQAGARARAAARWDCRVPEARPSSSRILGIHDRPFAAAASWMGWYHGLARTARSSAITVLQFRGADHGTRFAVLAGRARIGGGNQLGLDLIIDRPVDISRADIGVKNGLIMGELIGASGAVGQFRPVRRSRGLRRRRSDRRGRARGLIAAAKC